MAKVKRKIFISHSSKDKKIINILVEILEYYLANGKTITSHDVIYTSSIKKEYKFKLASNIGDQSIKYAAESDIFIAYISDDYKNSEICMAELGCGCYNYLNKKPGFVFMPIKDDFVNFNDLTFVLNNRTALSKSFDEIINFFDAELNAKKLSNKTKDLLRINFDSVYSGFDYDLHLSKSNIKNYVVKTFNNSHPLKPYAFIQYVTRKMYNEFHTELSNLGEDELIWSTYKSPFEVKKIDLNKKYLTDWDIGFKDVISKRKRRLIIFDTDAEMKHFLNDKSHSKEEKSRKKAFLDANTKNLFYTLKDVLIDEYNNQGLPDKINATLYPTTINELYLEFAFIKSKDYNLEVLIFSDYDNKYSNALKDTEPLVFICPNDSDSKYTQKITDSLRINRMVAYRFDELIKKKIITKI